MDKGTIEELDTWLAEVELAHDKIKALAEDKITIKEFDKTIQDKENKKKYQED